MRRQVGDSEPERGMEKRARSKGVAQTYPNTETEKVWFFAMAKVFILNVAYKLAGFLFAAASTTHLKPK